jgi:hypothetical protein
MLLQFWRVLAQNWNPIAQHLAMLARFWELLAQFLPTNLQIWAVLLQFLPMIAQFCAMFSFFRALFSKNCNLCLRFCVGAQCWADTRPAPTQNDWTLINAGPRKQVVQVFIFGDLRG